MNNVTRTRFPNGLTLLTRPSDHNDVVAIYAVLPAGSWFDPPGRGGVAALTFSLLLKDTKKRSSTEAAEYLESVGGNIGEEVRKDTAGLSIVCTSAGVPAALETLADAFRIPLFLPEQVELEKHSQILSIREEEDAPLAATFKLFQRVLYGSHPYASPTRGEPAGVAALTRQDVLAFYQGNIGPGNLVVAVVGNFAEKEVLDRVASFLGDWERDHSPVSPVEAAPGGPSGDGTVDRVRSGEGLWSVLGYLAPSVTDPDYAPMKVLDCILGGSVDSRLFSGVRDRRGLAYTVGTAFPERRGPGFFAAYWGTSPGMMETTLSAVRAEIDSLTETSPSEEEMDRARAYLRGIYVIGRETNLGEASLLGYSESIGWGLAGVDSYPERIAGTTADDVLRVARKHLTRPILAVTRPREG